MRPVFGRLLVLLASPCIAAQKVVCIDPGHPSEVGRGAEGAHVSEIRIAWQVAQRLKAKLEKAGVRVVMTKTSEDQFATNVYRASVANNAKADLMVRLHCDDSRESGFTTYYPERQGRSGKTLGPKKALLAKIAPIAKLFHKELAASLKGVLTDQGLKGDEKTAVGRHQGALTGSIFSTVPVVLVEMCVLTNTKDEKFIMSDKGQDRMAEALCRATLAAVKGK